MENREMDPNLSKKKSLAAQSTFGFHSTLFAYLGLLSEANVIRALVPERTILNRQWSCSLRKPYQTTKILVKHNMT